MAEIVDLKGTINGNEEILHPRTSAYGVVCKDAGGGDSTVAAELSGISSAIASAVKTRCDSLQQSVEDHIALLETAFDVGDVSGTTSMNTDKGRSFRMRVTGSVTINVTGASIRKGTCLLLVLVNGGKSSIRWGMSPKWASSAAPVLTPSGTDLLGFTFGADGAWYGVHISSNAG